MTVQTVRLAAYREFNKSTERLKTLYEATMHSYQVMYDTGRERLKSPDAKNDRVVFKFGETQVERPLRVITGHARDVYPDLLRSTLLVRLVASFEAFLIDIVQELSTRSMKPFSSQSQISISPEQLLNIDQGAGIGPYIVQKTLRNLTSGGLKEIRKFYKKKLNIDLVPNGVPISKIEEIHERRHLFVHRDGYADASYVHNFPAAGVRENEKILVSEEYLVEAIKTLRESALHIKFSAEAVYPAPPRRIYQAGNFVFPQKPSNIQYVSFQPLNAAGRAGFADLTLNLSRNKTLRDIVAWISDDGVTVRMLIAGEDKEIRSLRKAIISAEKRGDLLSVDSFKVKR